MIKVRADRIQWLIALLLVFGTAAVYSPVIHFEFVNYDDPAYILDNPVVQRGLTTEGAVWSFTTGHASNWHPLTWLSHMADCHLHGLEPGGHHFTSLLLHTLNTLLLFCLLRRMTGATWPSAAAAALFAWHPMHVESVAWVSERKDVLSGCFWMLTMLAYARYAERPGIRRYLWVLGFFVLGLLSKPMLVTLPFVLLLLDFWPLTRFPGARQTGGIKVLFRLIAEKLPLVALAAVSSVVTFLVQRKGGAVSPLDVLPLEARAGNALVSYIRYLGKLFWPVDLAIPYPHPGHWAPGIVAASVLLLAAITGAVFFTRRRLPFLTVGWLWYLGVLVPVIGIVQVGIQSMADRYSYIPFIGLFVMLAWSGAVMANRWPRYLRAQAVVCASALAGCLIVTSAQVMRWQSSETLFGHSIRVTRGNFIAHGNLGLSLARKGRVDEAISHYRKALEIEPDFEDGRVNLGFALAGRGEYDEAVAQYREALRINLYSPETHYNLGNALAELGRLDEAVLHFQTTLALKPGHAKAHNNLGIVMAMQGRYHEAEAHLKAAVSLNPEDPGARSNLGNSLAVQGRYSEAIVLYREGLRINPRDAQAHNNLGNALAAMGDAKSATIHYRRALALNGNNPEAHFNLGLALLQLGQTGEAKAHFTEALRLRPNHPDARSQFDALSVHPQ